MDTPNSTNSIPDEPLLPDEPSGIPEEHPLRRLFRSITKKAFSRFAGIYHPAVEQHISDEVLSEFVHIDRIHRIRDASGKQLKSLPEMALEARTGQSCAGVERDLELHQHTGDYALFMAGIFPECIEGRRRPIDAKPLLACVGSSVVALDRPRDYYIVEGRSAYSHVARIYRSLDPPRSGVFDRLANRFEDYLDLMECIRGYLKDSRGVGD